MAFAVNSAAHMSLPAETPAPAGPISQPLRDMHKPRHPTLEETQDVIRNHFQLDPVNDVVNFEVLRRESDPEAFDRIRARFQVAVSTRPDAAEIRRRSFFGPTFAILLQSVFPRSEIQWIRPDLAVHYPVCTAEEIRRIQDPKSVEDDLLALRADAIADSARLKRVFLQRRNLRAHDWSLTSYFQDAPFQQYLAALPAAKRAACRKLPAGFAFLLEPNGACMRSSRGDFIVVSEALEHYLYYMNAFLFEPEELPDGDRGAALMIAVRTMFLKESMDFDLDPRGALPPALDQRLRAVVQDQLQFVIGHEYGHVLLGHLNRHPAGRSPKSLIPAYVKRKLQCYTPLHNQELAADAASLLDPDIDDSVLADRLMGATWLFLGLEVLYGVQRFIKGVPNISKTHPPPIERLWALNEKVLDERPSVASLSYSKEEIEHLVERVLHLKGTLLEHFIPNNREQLEVYGSVYMPSFRKTPLVDWVDL